MDDIEETLAEYQRMALERGLPMNKDDLELIRRLIPLCRESGECPRNMFEVAAVFEKDPKARDWVTQHMKDREKFTKSTDMLTPSVPTALRLRHQAAMKIARYSTCSTFEAAR